MTGQGACIFGCEGPRLTPAETAFFRDADPFGFILFARNVEDPAQLAALTADLRAAVGREAPVFIDQEGGRVARMRPPHWRDWLPPLEQVAQTRRHAARAMYLRYRIIADELRAVGIDGNAAPVADLARPETHAILRNRCYGEDVLQVAKIAGAVAEGLLDGGVLPVMKHIPGHGRATVDSHLGLPRASEKKKVLKTSDFLPFEALAGLPVAMTAHVVYEAIDPDNPATTSPGMIRLIREEIGFAGLLLSDDLSMQALSGSLGERAGAARAAGCDIALHCNGDQAEMRAVAAASGRLDGPSAERAARALAMRAAPRALDMAAAEDEFRSLMYGQAGHG